MQYTYPDYYKEFKCLAGECLDTCCAGWQIVIDDASIEKYKNISDDHPFKTKLFASVDWEEEVFNQDKCGRCAFLNKENLCDMYIGLGEESLCHTCSTYPRHIEEFEGLREVTLSLSCPEVARILMEKTAKTTFYMEETSEEEDYEEYEDFDDLVFGILQDIRTDMIGIMQDRTISLKDRTGVIWKLSDELQACLDDGEVFCCEDILDRYRKSYKSFGIGEEQDKNQLIDYDKALEMFKYLYRLEVLDEAWEKQVDETSLTLYGEDKLYYEKLRKEFDCWLEENMMVWNVQAEQIVVYFLSTYLCGAVYDGLVSSKVKMAVAAVFFIHEILMALWLKNGRKIEMQDIINVVYRYSRELEHSDINLEEMETCFG